MTTDASEQGANMPSGAVSSAEHRQYVESKALIVEHILALTAKAEVGKRVLIGLVGAPGSGKSTLAAHLVELLNRSLVAQGQSAVIFPMDGFHLDNNILDSHESRAVKGSPLTFDAAGFVSLLSRISIKSERSIYAPVFDRTADQTRNAAQEITPQHSVVVVEGNYLLLNRADWCDVKPLLDCTVMLDVPMSTLESRLIQRWLDHGHTPEEARKRALSNDIPNARLVLLESMEAALHYKSVRQ